MTGISATPLQLSQSMSHDYHNGMQHAYPVNYGWTGFRSSAICLGTVRIRLLRSDPLQRRSARDSTRCPSGTMGRVAQLVATGGTLLIWPAKQRDLESTQEAQLKLDSFFLKAKPRAKQNRGHHGRSSQSASCPSRCKTVGRTSTIRRIMPLRPSKPRHQPRAPVLRTIPESTTLNVLGFKALSRCCPMNNISTQSIPPTKRVAATAPVDSTSSSRDAADHDVSDFDHPLCGPHRSGKIISTLKKQNG